MTTPTPDTATVRGRYCDGTYLQTGHTTEGEDFDRWLAEHDRETRMAGYLAGWLEATGHHNANREDHR